MNNITYQSNVPRMRTIPQFKKEFPELQLSERYLRSLAKKNLIACVHVGRKTLINVDSLFSFLNGEGA